MKSKTGELRICHKKLYSGVAPCDNLPGANLAHACCPRGILIDSPFTLKNDIFYGWVIHCMIGPLIANAKKSALLVRERHAVLKGFQKNSEVI